MKKKYTHLQGSLHEYLFPFLSFGRIVGGNLSCSFLLCFVFVLSLQASFGFNSTFSEESSSRVVSLVYSPNKRVKLTRTVIQLCLRVTFTRFCKLSRQFRVRGVDFFLLGPGRNGSPPKYPTSSETYIGTVRTCMRF